MPRMYGRKPDDYSKPKLDLTGIATTADFSNLPATADYLNAFSGQWKMLGNGPDPEVSPQFAGAGDCVAARAANSRLLLTGRYPADVLSRFVWPLYKTQNPDFDPLGDPNVNGPGSPADQGMATDQLLDYLHKVGTPDGVKVVAYGTIAAQNIEAVNRAIGAFGSVWVDILVQPGNQTEFDQRQPWTNTGEPPEGAHAVLAGGYQPKRLIETWAQEVTLDDSFWTGKVNNDALVERVYLVIWPEHATHPFVSSETGQMLADQYQALTGKELSWPVQPTPAPPPPPPPNPDVILAHSAHEWLRHHHGSPVNVAFVNSVRTWLAAKGY